MRVVESAIEMHEWAIQMHGEGRSIGFVATQGCLHQGHEHLLQAARKENSCAVLSVFVNPLQFRRSAYEVYPRTLDADLEIARKNDIDVVFVPGVQEMYHGADSLDVLFGLQDHPGSERDSARFLKHKAGPACSIDYVRVPERLVMRMDGADHPWHYDGVATVVRRLFETITPTRAYFGQKDIQQLAIIRSMTDWTTESADGAQDGMPSVEIVPVPIVRDAEGLSTSSRLVMLDVGQRSIAVSVTKLVEEFARSSIGQEADRMIERFRRETDAIKLSGHSLEIDSLSCVDPLSLEPVSEIVSGAMIYLAYIIDGVRLAETRECC